ncbi:hypothetical protein CIB95_12085 [Lottiidibacillus patelloidae]|uniref:Uncharacterized protein n=1 Tax=Lottiidibacillus patelloidae TaxID=2670334 RepID=A0A263BS31_9BACI|nr:hypothetical protein CIB95_12085 [Lottiidibacillus patelloidae]
MLFVFIMWLILVALLLYKQRQDTPSIFLNCLVVFIGYLLIFEGIAQIEKHPFTFIRVLLILSVITIIYFIGRRFLGSQQSTNKVNM